MLRPDFSSLDFAQFKKPPPIHFSNDKMNESDEKSLLELQANNLWESPFVQHFIETFDKLFYKAVLSCRISNQILW